MTGMEYMTGREDMIGMVGISGMADITGMADIITEMADMTVTGVKGVIMTGVRGGITMTGTENDEMR